MTDSSGRRLADDTTSGALAAALLAVAEHKPGSDALRAAVDMAIEVTGCTDATITSASREYGHETAAASSARVLAADLLQIEFGEGPSLDAIGAEDRYVICDLASTDLWPRWQEKARELGIAAVMSVQLVNHHGSSGALNLYSRSPRAYGTDDVTIAQVIAAHVSVVLTAAREMENLWRTIDARNLIGQAQGILMNQFGVSAESAFAVLRRYSQNTNIKLRDVAAQVADTGELPVDAATLPLPKSPDQISPP